MFLRSPSHTIHLFPDPRWSRFWYAVPPKVLGNNNFASFSPRSWNFAKVCMFDYLLWFARIFQYKFLLSLWCDVCVSFQFYLSTWWVCGLWEKPFDKGCPCHTSLTSSPSTLLHFPKMFPESGSLCIHGIFPLSIYNKMQWNMFHESCKHKLWDERSKSVFCQHYWSVLLFITYSFMIHIWVHTIKLHI